MKRLWQARVFVLALGVTGTVGVLAQAPPPSVDDILAKYVQALGGKEAIEKQTSRASKGTFEVPDQGISAPFELYAKAPDKSLTVVTIEGYGQIRQGCDGKTAWRQNPQMGVQEMAGEELSSALRSAVFHQATKLRNLYPKMTLKGKEKVGEAEAYVIEADPGDGSLRRLYIDAQSGLLVRTDLVEDTSEGRETFQSYLSDYKPVDGVQVPFTIRQVSSGIAFTIHLSEVHSNVALDDAIFTKPAS